MVKKIEIEKAKTRYIARDEDGSASLKIKNCYLLRDEDGNVTLLYTIDEVVDFLRIIFE